ncbi:MAG: HPr family phosphocarrier protein [Deltaproteobacteria bacterium]|jgi:phosphocarrier protein|nr:HPr family phosphocarrier protein [Deltaproteobacteria bacterium]
MSPTNVPAESAEQEQEEPSEGPRAEQQGTGDANPFGQFGLDGDPEIVVEAVILNRLGLHGRAAARLVAAIEDFDCEIFVEKGSFRADAKSILDLLTLCCSKATRIRIGASGPDAGDAVDAALRVIGEGFGEEE